jgi:hypothetical protein
LSSSSSTITITDTKERHAVWREPRARAVTPRRHEAPPIGTTFSFVLNERAHIRFAFTQQTVGRLVGHKCLSLTNTRHPGHRCQQSITRGTIEFTGQPGINTVNFHGRASHAIALRPGRYALLISATNGTGNVTATPMHFTIVE